MSREMSVDPKVFDGIRAAAERNMDQKGIEALLLSHFAGKRDAIRTYRFVDATITGKNGTFQALAVDLSRSGMLLRITDENFATPDEMAHLMTYTTRVWLHFEGGMTVAFTDTDVTATATVVRVTGYCGTGSSLILTGCRFDRMLGERDCEKLGIEFADDRVPGSSS